MTSSSEMEQVLSRTICSLLALVLIATGPLSVHAQASDGEPPVIEYQPVGSGAIGEDQLFVVEVTDNNAVESVILNYRTTPDADYENLSMERDSDSDRFRATVPQQETLESSTIEYYFEATDVSGNRTLEGFAFNPLLRVLVDAAELPATPVLQESGPFANLTSGKNLLYVALGVLAVGVLIAASSDGGGSDNDEQGVDVTVVVDQLPIEN